MCPLLSVAENYDRYFASPLYEMRYPYPNPSSLATTIGKIGARGNRVLDFGCGNGRYTAPLLELTGATIVATTSARKRIKPSRFLGDAHELWTRFHSDGRRVCAWLASGEWPTECRNKPLLTSTDVGGLQHGLLITGPHRTDAQHSNLRFSCSILIGVVLVNLIGDARAYGAEYVNEDAVQAWKDWVLGGVGQARSVWYFGLALVALLSVARSAESILLALGMMADAESKGHFAARLAHRINRHVRKPWLLVTVATTCIGFGLAEELFFVAHDASTGVFIAHYGFLLFTLIEASKLIPIVFRGAALANEGLAPPDSTDPT